MNTLETTVLVAVAVICWAPVVWVIAGEIRMHRRSRAAVRRMDARREIDLTNPIGRRRLGINEEENQ